VQKRHRQTRATLDQEGAVIQPMGPEMLAHRDYLLEGAADDGKIVEV
jgi:hypothetical protein